MEKTWHGLAMLFAAKGHTVTFVSRSWPSLPLTEVSQGVRHLRVGGFNHTRFLPANLLLDFLWALKVAWVLPPGDVVICNAVSLPALLPWLKPSAGLVTVAMGRLPKGQVLFYRRVVRIYAPTQKVAEQIGKERPAAIKFTRVVGYPIEWALLHGASAQKGHPVVIGFTGRLNPEKGIEILFQAAAKLAERNHLPEWKLMLVGPSSVNEGGGGERWIQSLEAKYGPPFGGRLVRLAPEYDAKRLATLYGSMDIFCYPSVSDRGETFGVSIAEAMAAGAAVVVSGLDCFKDLVTDGSTGLVFDHRGPDPSTALADCLETLVVDSDRRRSLASNGQEYIRRFDFGEVSRFILGDLAELTGAGRVKQT